MAFCGSEIPSDSVRCQILVTIVLSPGNDSILNVPVMLMGECVMCLTFLCEWAVLRLAQVLLMLGGANVGLVNRVVDTVVIRVLQDVIDVDGANASITVLQVEARCPT